MTLLMQGQCWELGRQLAHVSLLEALGVVVSETFFLFLSNFPSFKRSGTIIHRTQLSISCQGSVVAVKRAGI